MKILLMVPPGVFLPGETAFCTFPLGVAYLAAVLEKNNFDVTIIDCLTENQERHARDDGMYTVGMSWQAIRERLASLKPDIVGISNTYSVQASNVLKLASIIKESSNVKVALGGAHPSALAEEILNDNNIDFVIIGEGEDSFLELIKSLNENKPFNTINGLGYKIDGQIRINPKTHYIIDLDNLPLPSWDLFRGKEKYLYSKNPHSNFLRRSPYMPVLTSRGCPGNCIFCSIHVSFGYSWRARSCKNVVDEIELLVKRFGIKEIHFEDDNLTFDRKRMMDICDEIISRKLDIVWTTPNGVHISNLDEELLMKMKKSGCYRLFLGIESGNNNVLKNIIRKKNVSLEKVREKVKLMKKLKIETVGFFVVGFPHETREEIKDTIKFANSLGLDDVLFSIASPYPGTDLWRWYSKQAWFSLDDYSRLRPKCSVLSTDLVSSDEIEKLRNRAYLGFEIHKFLRNPLRYISIKENLLNWKRYLKYFFVSLIDRKIKATHY